jgi:hypothetical protein
MIRSSFVVRTLLTSACLIGSLPALAQTVTVPQQPLSDINCPPGTQIYLIGTNCVSTTGTRTATPTTGTVTPQAGGVRVNGQWNVTYVGDLQTDGIPFSTVAGQQFNFDATQFYDPTAVTVNVNASYTGGYNNILLPTFDANLPGYFQTYTNQATTVNSLNVNIASGEFRDVTTNQVYNFSLTTPNPTAIQNGNAVALTGKYNQTDSDAIVFGTLGGTATLANVGVTPATQFGSPGGAWASPYRLQYAVTPTEKTRLDATGLVTPTISVTGGVNFNGSKATGLADGTAPTDAVNKGQLDALAANDFVAVNSTAVQPIAIAVGSIGIGGGAQATGLYALALGSDGDDAGGDGAQALATDAVAIGRDAAAFSSETTALGAGARAVFSGALAIGKGANANGSLSVAIGPNVQALSDDSIGIGAGSTPVGVRATAIGRSANALANGTAIGAGANAAHTGATAIGQNAVTSRADQIVLGTAANSITLPGLLTTSDAAQAGQEFFVTVDSNGTLGKGAQSSAAISQLGSQVGALQQSQALIDDQVAALQTGQLALGRGLRQANGGIAAAMAMGGMMVVPDSTVSLNFNLSTYRGSQGFSGGLAARVAPKVYISGGIAGSTVKGSTGGRVGIAFGL